MKLTAIRDFYDIEADVTRLEGETFEAAEARAEALLKAEVCKAEPEEAAEKPKKPARKAAKK